MEAIALQWIESSWLGQLAGKTGWVFGLAETVHFMGLSMLLGAMAVLDLRMLRIIRRIPIARLLDLIPLAIVGFTVQLVSGGTMFAAHPGDYWGNMAFRAKMVLIGIAGLNALWFWLVELGHVKALAPGEEARTSAKVVAGLSLGLWLVILTVGRLLAYLQEIDYSTLFGLAGAPA